MFFRKNKLEAIAEAVENADTEQSYWAIVKRQFRKNRIAVWSLRILYVLVFIAITGDFIANEKPIYCKLDGKSYFPVIRQYLVDLGMARWEPVFVRNDWSDHDYETVVFPPIPYSAGTLNPSERYLSPFGDQPVNSWRYRHWLGTNDLGKDIAAGMISGARTALSVGIVAMSIASVIGIFFGAIAGYFGDERLKASRVRIFMNVLGFVLAIFYAFSARSYALTEGGRFSWEFIKSLLIFLLVLALANGLAVLLEKLFSVKKKINIAADIIVMRLIEIMNSIPALILLLAILPILEKESILYVMVIIGLIAWTGIARFIRAELLRIRQLGYIEAAQSMGFGEIRILLRHAIPNALTPVLITIAFGIAGAILLEAFLSFLGIGVAAEEVTWGKMLNESRRYIKAWWLAVFPGMGIFVAVAIFNLIGEGLTDALNPKLRE